MKKLIFETREDWLEARKTKITGSKLKNIVVKRGTGQKIGYYELIAERLAMPGAEEDPKERGSRLEEEAIQRFEEETGKKVDASLTLWIRDDNESIALSPDGSIGSKEAVEVKCLSSARHIQAFFEKIPNEHMDQVYQYFIVNEDLEQLHFCFYDPRLQYKDFFFFTVTRDEVKEKAEEYLQYQRNVLESVNQIVKELSF